MFFQALIILTTRLFKPWNTWHWSMAQLESQFTKRILQWANILRFCSTFGAATFCKWHLRKLAPHPFVPGSVTSYTNLVQVLCLFQVKVTMISGHTSCPQRPRQWLHGSAPFIQDFNIWQRWQPTIVCQLPYNASGASDLPCWRMYSSCVCCLPNLPKGQ